MNLLGLVQERSTKFQSTFQKWFLSSDIHPSIAFLSSSRMLLSSFYAGTAKKELITYLSDNGNSFLDYLGNNQYQIKLAYYKDCGPSSIGFPPGSLKVGVFEIGTHQLKTVLQLAVDSTTTLDFSQAACVTSPVNCVQQRNYSAILTMPAFEYNHPAGYYFVYEQCCRNALAQNVANPQDIGSAYYMELRPNFTINQTFENSSPEFKNYPALLLCAFENYELDFSATEPDGDSLVYTLIDPLKGHANANSLTNQTGQVDPIPGPYDPIVWNTGYSLAGNILDGNPDIQVDTSAGLLSVNPQKIGVYLAAIKCEEFRNGIKISEIRREMQIAVVQCPNRFAPEIICLSNCTQQQLQPNEIICFEFLVSDSNLLDSIQLQVSFNKNQLLKNYTFSKSETANPAIAKLCLETNCNLKKGDRTPDEAGMPLRFSAKVPNLLSSDLYTSKIWIEYKESF